MFRVFSGGEAASQVATNLKKEAGIRQIALIGLVATYRGSR
ncbi:MAG TPA: hypothetical protein VGB67_05850 [Fibrella sp.]